jgi:hypothetical protein
MNGFKPHLMMLLSQWNSKEILYKCFTAIPCNWWVLQVATNKQPNNKKIMSECKKY